MINANMKSYFYYTIGSTVDAYGQEQISPYPQGTINMAIHIVSQSIGENINYKDATYLGLTQDAQVNDTYIIEVGANLLKVLYVVPVGRFKQVFMSEYGPIPDSVTLDAGQI